MNTCQIQQTTKMLKFVPANNTSLKVILLFILNLLWLYIVFVYCALFVLYTYSTYTYLYYLIYGLFKLPLTTYIYIEF